MSLDLLPEFERLRNVRKGFPGATGPDDDNSAVTKYSTQNRLLYSDALDLLRLPDLLFEALAIRDVAIHGGSADDRAAVASDGRNGDRNIDHGFVSTQAQFPQTGLIEQIIEGRQTALFRWFRAVDVTFHSSLVINTLFGSST